MKYGYLKGDGIIMAGENITLGEGVFSIGTKDIGLTRGGGQFVVEREYRQVNADVDRGPVKGRIRVTGSVARLTLNALEIIVADLAKLFPATKVTGGKFTGKQDIEDADYNDTVTWTGRTMDGKACVITLENAINLGNLDWTMADKDEIVQQVVLTAAYEEQNRQGEEEPWDVEWPDAV